MEEMNDLNGINGMNGRLKAVLLMSISWHKLERAGLVDYLNVIDARAYRHLAKGDVVAPGCTQLRFHCNIPENWVEWLNCRPIPAWVEAEAA